MNAQDNGTRVRLDCSEGCGGHYAAGLGGGQCTTCGHAVLWADITPHLDEGERPALVHDGTTAWLAVRLADDTRDE